MKLDHEWTLVKVDNPPEIILSKMTKESQIAELFKMYRESEKKWRQEYMEKTLFPDLE